MREIKFRGKQIKPIQSIWLYGDLMHSKDHKTYIQNTTCMEVAPETIGQYTGLKDKNGKEIYEGDIVELNEEGRKLFGTPTNLASKYEVVGFKDGAFMTGRNRFLSLNDTNYYNTYLWVIKNYIEVIGNIYDNPELLKEE